MRRRAAITMLAVVVLLMAAVAAVGRPNAPIGSRTHSAVHVAAICRQGPLPDGHCTPGAKFNVGRAQVCVPGYSERVRDVPESEKRLVYTEYGIRSHRRGQHEVAHLIPLELGGSDSLRTSGPRRPIRDRAFTRRIDWRTRFTGACAPGR